MKSPLVAVTVSHGSFKIYLDGKLHLRLPRATFIGLQAWVDSERGFYFIEYMIGERDVLTEYDKPETWAAILAQVDERLCRCNDRARSSSQNEALGLKSELRP